MDALLALIDRMNIWAWWALCGLILIAELLTGTTYLLWPAAAAFLTGLLALEALGVGWPVQLAVFAVLSLVLLWVGDRWVKPAMNLGGGEAGLNDRSGRMVGQRVTVVADFSAGRGRVRYGDSEWSAETLDEVEPKAGDIWIVTGVKGVVLTIASGAK